MNKLLELRNDYDAARVRELATTITNTKVVARLRMIADIYEGATVRAAARKNGTSLIAGEELVASFNSHGPEGLGFVMPAVAPAEVVKPSPEELRGLAAKSRDLLLGRRMTAIAELLEGGKVPSVGAKFGMMPLSLSNWRKRFDEFGVEGLTRWQGTTGTAGGAEGGRAA